VYFLFLINIITQTLKKSTKRGGDWSFAELWISNLACCIVAFIVLYCIQIINMNIVQNTYSIFIYKYIADCSHPHYIGTGAVTESAVTESAITDLQCTYTSTYRVVPVDSEQFTQSLVVVAELRLHHVWVLLHYRVLILVEHLVPETWQNTDVTWKVNTLYLKYVTVTWEVWFVHNTRENTGLI